MVQALRGTPVAFQYAKRLSIAGLALSLLMWLVAFLAVGGEWFLMWQSKTSNGQDLLFGCSRSLGLCCCSSPNRTFKTNPNSAIPRLKTRATCVASGLRDATCTMLCTFYSSGIVSFPWTPYSSAISRFKVVRVSNCEQFSDGCRPMVATGGDCPATGGTNEENLSGSMPHVRGVESRAGSGENERPVEVRQTFRSAEHSRRRQAGARLCDRTDQLYGDERRHRRKQNEIRRGHRVSRCQRRSHNRSR